MFRPLSTPGPVGYAGRSGVSTAAAQTWTYAESEHFEVYTTGGDRTARDALTYFERVHAFFTDFMKTQDRYGPSEALPFGTANST